MCHLTCAIVGDIIPCMESSQAYCACWVQIPLAYGGPDGSPTAPVEEEVIDKFLRVFDRQFGGWTPLTNRVGGSWRNPEHLFDKAIQEGSIRIEVAVLPNRTPEFREVVYAIGKKLKQKVMYYSIPEPSTYFMNIDEE